MNKAINKTKINKSPGRDKITGFWYKKLTFYRPDLANLFQQTLQGDTKLPKWLSLALTSLLPKNNETHIPKNYRPIACLNIMYKLFTSCLNLFLTDHVQSNNIITPEQAGGKRGVWGTTEQLLVNKNIMKEVKSLRRSLTTVWLDYKKAFDSVPHSWLIYALKLANVPLDIINAISNLTNCWYILNLQDKNESLMSEVIRFLKGIFQGDSLSVLLFVLALNPLSFMLKKEKGYLLGKRKIVKHTHNFFVDDLKLFAANRATLMKQLDIVTTFSEDIGMKFGEDKCAYLQIERGKIVQNEEPIFSNQLTIKPVKVGDCYRLKSLNEITLVICLHIFYSGLDV